MRRYSFKKFRRQVGLSEQVDPISITNLEEDHQKDDLQQQQLPLHQEEHTQVHILERIHIPNNAQKEQVGKQWLQIYGGRKCVLIKMMRLGMFLLQ